jgi:hypothetical protein
MGQRLRTELQKISVLGFARPSDFLIRLTGRWAYLEIGTRRPETIPTYVHEWTHFFHFHTSSLGDLIAELERNKFFINHSLAIIGNKVAGRPLPQPMNQSIRANSQVLSDERVATLIAALDDTVENEKTLLDTWSGLVSKQDIDLGRLRAERPFTLNVDEAKLRFRRADGTVVDLRITGRQQLEHAAMANELPVTGFLLGPGSIHPDLMDYVGLFLFLFQEGVIDIDAKGRSGWRVSSTNEAILSTRGIVTSVFICCQLALMLYGAKPGPVPPTTAVGPSGRPEIVMPTELVTARMVASAKVLAKLLARFKEFAIRFSVDSGGPSPEAIEAICAEIDAGSYFEMVEAQRARARQVVARFGGQEADPVVNQLQSIILEHFLQTSCFCFEALAENPSASWRPVDAMGDFPSPDVIVDSITGPRRVQLAGSTSFPMVKPISTAQLSLFFCSDMVVLKLLHDDDLVCYLSGCDESAAEATRAGLSCPHFRQCFRQLTPRTCNWPDWFRKTASFVKAYGGSS